MSRNWVVNSSPLIVLAKARRLDLLLELCDNPIIPEGVADELMQGPENDPARLWIRGDGAAFVEPVARDARVEVWDLGAGETDVLSRAIASPGLEVVVDDRAARKAAGALGVRVVGTIGVILAAKLHGKLPEVRPVLEDVVRAGLRIDVRQLNSALRLAGELPG